MGTKISHSGVVETIADNCVKVRIVQASACAACKIAGHCNAAEAKDKVIDVYDALAARRYQVGQQVTVSTSGSVAFSATMWGFGIPFALLVVVLVVVLQLTGNEALAALCGLGSLIPYYILLWTFRERMRKQLSFTIE